jgi:hypothetical protein
MSSCSATIASCASSATTGAYGVEAQFYRNEEFAYSRRFDRRLVASRPSRELAIQWAESERAALEASGVAP